MKKRSMKRRPRLPTCGERWLDWDQRPRGYSKGEGGGLRENVGWGRGVLGLEEGREGGGTLEQGGRGEGPQVRLTEAGPGSGQLYRYTRPSIHVCCLLVTS